MTRPTVTLRRIELADWPAVHAWARLPESCRYQTWGPNDEEQTRAYVAAAAGEWSRTPRRALPYAAHVDGEVLGMGTLHLRDAAHRQGEITYIVHPRAWGRGVATAIGAGLLGTAFAELGLHRVYATCDPRNAGSARVLAKLGMTCEGRLRHTTLIRDGWRDSELFSILEHEWRPPA
ncbi:GNAT family N-acetyltransferase [Actinomadura sp. ATCC 31491]|uniref:GNAT family N-acetyltransferase n=1 Tax=Actinomadura luzonensis TaxID=2805427 RepID=A0ABT0G2F0_9ACTN|nr:GNAT family N-acetyltransferase [Actinomadura luzonensis]MCK2218777.1 GNAT family N-acetyltransferase [Actinomadura luzonensis]